jgi:large subunit ribosomal protein L24
MAAKIRKGDKVVVLSGRDKGRTGEVFEVRPDASKALVGGIISKEAPIHLSNIAIVGKDGKPTRVGFKIQADGTKVRIAKRSGAEIDG